MLQLNDLRLHAAGEPARLEMGTGQITVLLGRNNSGKTNLLRFIAGLPGKASAELTIDGQPMNSVPVGSRPVGFVFQAFVNYPHWTVQANIESPLRARGVARSERLARVRRIARLLQIEELLDRKPDELSGGQQQRLAIARALAAEARVLLLDEPFVNLDFRLRERLTLELGDLLRESGTTVVFSTSDCRDAFALADQVVLLHEQNVLQAGKLLSLYRNPVSLPAADLLSEPGVNWLDDGAGLEIVRPEHLQLAPPPQSSAHWSRYSIAVAAVETSGSDTWVQGELCAPAATAASARWVVRLAGMPELDNHLQADNSLTVYLDPANRLYLPHAGDRSSQRLSVEA